ncbi:MAG: nucleotidyltransferase family protein [Rhodobacteraceae bacterium]|nr:MAG: nucleotidyltransferase family protein [Paracoccaceae bacterium]
MRGCAILLPAAGAATRMRGQDKLLEHVNGQPILRHVAQLALTVSAHLAVSLRDPDPARQKSLEGLPLTRLCLPDASEGMAASLRAGASWAMVLPVGALMIALPDMPDITAQDMRALIAAQAAHSTQALRASDMAGRAGHPVILPRRLFADMLQLRGDEGARQLLRRHPPRLHPLQGKRALTDLDTPEDWAAWRAGGH